MSRFQLLTALLCCLPLAGQCKHAEQLGAEHHVSAGHNGFGFFGDKYTAGLQCYTCVFPAISPLDCFKFPQECPAGQRCLSSTAMGRRGSLQMTMYEKSCAIPSQCGVSGQKYASGLYFNYTNVCCDTDLCNGAVSVAALGWGGLALCLLPALAQLLA